MHKNLSLAKEIEEIFILNNYYFHSFSRYCHLKKLFYGVGEKSETRKETTKEKKGEWKMREKLFNYFLL